jgi:hypothetical protein
MFLLLVNVLVSEKGTLCHNMPYLYLLPHHASTNTILKKFKVAMSKETQNESYMSPFKATILQNSLFI